MEESEEFKWAVKVVIKRQMRDLIEQLRENGEEIAILSADLDCGSCSHFGSPKGEWFMSEQRNLSVSFLNFCKMKANKRPRDQIFSDDGSQQVQTPAKITRVMQGVKKTLVKVFVPAKHAECYSDEQLAVLVGRMVVAKLTGLLQTVSSPLKRISKTRSGRDVSSTFQTALNSLKKSKDRDESYVASQLQAIKKEDLQRFEVCTESGRTVDLQSVTASVQQLEDIAEHMMQAVDDLLTSHTLMEDRVKIVVTRVYGRTRVDIEVEEQAVDAEEPSSLELDMEVSGMDSDGADVAEIDPDTEDRDPDFKPPKHIRSKDGCHSSNGLELTSPSSNSTLFSKSVVAEKITDEENVRLGPDAIAKPASVPQKALNLRIGMRLKKLKEKRGYKKKKKPVDCPHCGITLSELYNLQAHIRRIHLKIFDYKCSICDKGFFTPTSLETHMITVHTRMCNSCKAYVIESVPWTEGMKQNVPRVVTCICGASVIIVSRIGLKKRGLDDEYIEDQPQFKEKHNYACGICGRLFAKKSDCENHAKGHTVKKEFMCKVCGIGFKAKNVLSSHMLREHGIYTNKCEVCSKNLASKLALKVHMSKEHPKSSTSALPDPDEVMSEPSEQVTAPIVVIQNLITDEIVDDKSSVQQ